MSEAPKLSEEIVEGWLKGHSGWRRKDDTLVKDFEFDSFRSSIIFMNRLAALRTKAMRGSR